MSEFIKETSSYKVETGPTCHHSDTPGLVLYQIINKKHNVVEMETSVLATALRTVEKLQDELDAILLEDNEAYLAMVGSEGAGKPN